MLGGLVLLGVLIAAAISARVTIFPTGTSPGSPAGPASITSPSRPAPSGRPVS